MQRRGISEAVSVVLLLAVIATASYFALNGSTKKTTESERSVAETIALKGTQAQELLAVISKNTTDEIAFEILNYGPKEIVVEMALVDGTPSSFIILDSAGNVFSNNTIPQKEIMRLEMSGAGQSVQIVTGSKNVLSLS